MRGKEKARPTDIDPRCIQEALRMYLQPIKSDDPKLDFYNRYERETTAHDDEYMKRDNEDLNTILIFAGLFSAVSSAFVIAVQARLQPDSSERSEAYLRAILLSLNRSVIPNEDPAAPPAWNGPPTEIVTTVDLLYASLLMSLFAAFVAMLGKLWLNRYLRHTGGSMIERCGDRQRKFDGMEKWSFRLFIESLPVILQISLLLLICGLSRYMWLINISVARVVTSFTALGILFYIGIVVAGISSYECPFQTPASIALRHLRDSGIARKCLTSLTPPNFNPFTYATRRVTQKLPVNPPPPYTTWMDAREGFVSASRRAYEITRSPFSWDVSLSGIHSAARTVGHQTIVLLLRIDRAFGNAKYKLVQGVRRFGRAGLLPTTVEDVTRHPLVSQNGPGLRVHVWDLEALRRQNAADARCVSWVLWSITDPEAIDSAVRLAGTIQWFDGDSNYDPPFDFIVSTFEACFDSAGQPYPGMRDRAYFSAQAILQINLRSRAQSRERVPNYPIPAVASSSFKHTDPDLHHIVRMLQCNSGSSRPILDFPRVDTNTHAHSMWLSNLFVDLTRVGPNPILKSYKSYLSAAVTNNKAMIANTLLMWYMLLGGRVEEETLWAVDKSNSLETILSLLSAKITNVLTDGDYLQHIEYLLEFLAAWEERPAYLTPMAYQWCSAISEAAGRLGPSEPPDDQLTWGQDRHQRQLRLRPQNLATEVFHTQDVESGFSETGPGCDPVRLDDTSYRTRGNPHALTLDSYVHLLSIALDIGFRLAAPSRDQPVLHSNRTPYHEWVFETAFSSRDDEFIADAVSAWIMDRGRAPPGSFARYFTGRMERDTPFSPRLRQMGLRAIERIHDSKLKMSELETVRLLNCLNVNVDEVEWDYGLVMVLIEVIRSPTGSENLSPHNWRLLDKLAVGVLFHRPLVSRDVEVMRMLEEAEDWEKLEVWMGIIWWFTPSDDGRGPGSTQDIEQATLNLLSRRPSALPRFKDLCDRIRASGRDALRRICDQAPAE